MPRAGTMGEPLIAAAPTPAEPMRAAEPLSPRVFLRNEMGMVFGVATMGIFQLFGTAWVANLSNKVKAVALFAWLFVAIFWLAFGVVRHADCLAVLLGEPYGTLILTVSVIGIEAAMMAALMLQGEDNPTLARDTMFSVIMIVLTGIVGVTLLLGGLFHEQNFNLSGALSYLRVLTPMAILSLVVPRFTRHDGGQVSTPLGIWLLLMSGGLYGVFLFHQTKSHSRFFEQPPDSAPAASRSPSPSDDGDEESAAGVAKRPQPDPRATPGNSAADAGGVSPLSLADDVPHEQRRDSRGSIVLTPTHGHDLEVRTTRFHAVMLFATMLPIVLLAKFMSKMIKFIIDEMHWPQELGGFFVAILILSPECITAIKAALDHQLQRTINIALGSATSTMCACTPTFSET